MEGLDPVLKDGVDHSVKKMKFGKVTGLENIPGEVCNVLGEFD